MSYSRASADGRVKVPAIFNVAPHLIRGMKPKRSLPFDKTFHGTGPVSSGVPVL